MTNFIEVTDNCERERGEQRWYRKIEPGECWISVKYRLTGFGWFEWETAIVVMIEPGSRPMRWSGDDRDIFIIAGDRREELDAMPKDELRKWYDANIEGNRNSFDSVLNLIQNQTVLAQD